MKKKLLGLCILCLFSVMLLAGCKNKNKNTTNTSTDPAVNPNYVTENYLSGKHYVQMDVENYGTIVLELNADAAPATVTNFINLVTDGFYNGLTFHRIINGFMMQGGDPEANGTGGSEFAIPGEFSANGYENPISHTRGTISMARANDYNTASSQFFIVHQDAIALDGSYAAFGNVYYGMDVVDAICASVAVEDSNGTVAAENQPVISSAFVLDDESLEVWTYWKFASLPDPTAEISFSSIESTEGFEFVDTWNIHEDGQTFIVFSSENLKSLGIYNTDLATGTTFDTSAPLAYYKNLAANACICIKLNVPKEEFPSLILVAEEASGALGQYLICYDETGYYGGAYLVPVY